MQCERFEARLQDLLDQRQRPECDAQLLKHADACENCREILLLQEQMFAGMELWDAPSLDDAFAARVVAQAVAEKPRIATYPTKTRRSSLPWRLFAGALAASLLVGVVTVASRWNNSPSAPEEVAHQNPQELKSPVVVPAPQPEIALVPPVAPQSDQSVPPTIEGASLPDHLAAQWVENAPELLDGRATGRMIREVTYSLAEVDAVEEHIPGLRPITNSLGVTFSLFRKTLPGGRDPSLRNDSKSPPSTKPQADVSREGHANTA